MERQAVAKVQKTPTGNNHPHRQSTRSTSAGHTLLELQRAVGNQAIRRLTSSPFIQAKLQVSAPEDESEQEADRVADTVMRMPEPVVSRPDEEDKIVAPKSKSRIPVAVRDNDDEEEKPLVQRACTECEEEKLQDQGESEEVVHRESGAQTAPKVTSSVASNIQAMNGGGSSLPATTRAFFEPRLGADLRQERVHTDSRAAATANSIQAKAFTVGSNIAFAAGRYAPHSHEGRHLLAHELTHVVQQSPVISRSCKKPEAVNDRNDLNALLNEILPSIGLLADINRTVQLHELFGGELLVLARRVFDDPEARTLTCTQGVAGMAALFDTRLPRGALQLDCAKEALQKHPEHYSQSALTGSRYKALPEVFTPFSETVTLFEQATGSTSVAKLDAGRRLQLLAPKKGSERLHVRVISTRKNFCQEGFIEQRNIQQIGGSVTGLKKVTLVFVQNTERIKNTLLETRLGTFKKNTRIKLESGKTRLIKAGEHCSLLNDGHTDKEFFVSVWINDGYKQGLVPKDSLTDDIQQRTRQRLFMLDVAMSLAKSRKSIFVDTHSGDCSAKSLPIEYFTGTDIVRGIEGAANCTETVIDEVHIVSHGGSHGISGTGDLNDAFGIYLNKRDPKNIGEGGLTTSQFVNATSAHFSSGIRIWLHGCLTAAQNEGGAGFAEELGGELRDTKGGTSSVAGLADRGTVNRGIVKSSSFVIFPGKAKVKFK